MTRPLLITLELTFTLSIIIGVWLVYPPVALIAGGGVGLLLLLGMEYRRNVH